MNVDSASRVIICALGQFIIRSSDLIHWDTLPLPDVPATSLALGKDGKHFGVVGSVLFGGTPHVMSSTDDGSSWVITTHTLPGALTAGNGMSATGLVYTKKHTLLLSTSDLALARVEPLGLYRSTNDGSSWYHYSLYGQIRDSISGIAMTDDGTIFAATIDTNGILRSTDDGLTWVRMHPIINPSTDLRAPKELTHAVKLASLGGSNLFWSNNLQMTFISHDYGITWDWSPVIPISDDIFQINEDSHGYAYMNYMRTSDYGYTWTALTLPGGEKPMINAVESNGGIYDITASSLWHSTDHGDTWTKISKSPATVDAVQLVVDSVGKLYAFYSNACYRSTDAGVSWSSFRSGIREFFSYPAAIAVSSTERLFYIGIKSFYRTIATSANSIRAQPLSEALLAQYIAAGTSSYIHIDLSHDLIGTELSIEVFDELGRRLFRHNEMATAAAIDVTVDHLLPKSRVNLVRISCGTYSQVLKMIVE